MDGKLFETTKPLLLLDVDGVLWPYAASQRPPGFRSYVFFNEEAWFAPHYGEWLRPLCDLFQIAWATAWEHDANRLLAPIFGLPPLPVITFARDANGRFRKFPQIAQRVPDQPLVWIDDELPSEAYRWAAARRSPTQLLAVNPAIGLTPDMIAACEIFAAGLAR